MVALSDVPLNSITWLVGTLACATLCYRSYSSYRRSGNELSKYIAWFGLIMGIAQAIFAFPSFFTLDLDILRATYHVGEFFIYSSAVAQAAILWCLILRSRMSIYFVTIPVGIIGLVSWLYALPSATMQLDGNFLTYRDPAFSTAVVGVAFISLFVPVGIYFLREAAKQTQRKALLNSLALGLVYVGIGLSTGGYELLAGEVITPSSAVGDLVFFTILLIVVAWPRSQTSKPGPLKAQKQS